MVPHLITEEQRKECPTCVQELLKIKKKKKKKKKKKQKKNNGRVNSNLLTGDETWINMLEPPRKVDNKQRKRRDQARLCIAKRNHQSEETVALHFLLTLSSISF